MSWAITPNCLARIYLAIPNGTNPAINTPDVTALAQYLLPNRFPTRQPMEGPFLTGFRPRLYVTAADAGDSISSEIWLQSADQNTASWVAFVDELTGDTTIWWQIVELSPDMYIDPATGAARMAGYFLYLESIANFGF